MSIGNQVNRAIELYLGWPAASIPLRDQAAVVTEFGPVRGPELEMQVHDLIHEMGRIPIDWQALTVTTASSFVRSELASLHPELNESSLDALAWTFRWAWR
jgi:hypothetical protein